MDYQELPGGARVQRGLDDLAAGRDSVDADLVRLGAPRLARLGFDVPAEDPDAPPADERLFRKLVEDDPARAHAAYNALVAELVRFECLVKWLSNR